MRSRRLRRTFPRKPEHFAERAGQGCRGITEVLPTDNFWYAWLIAALARGVVRNETDDKYTAMLADMTLREIANMSVSEPDFYDT